MSYNQKPMPHFLQNAVTKAASTQTVTCPCGNTFEAKTADIRRGWGKFCSKSCKAKEQEQRTGQHLTMRVNKVRPNKSGSASFWLEYDRCDTEDEHEINS
jgi:hypothetical protein